MKNKGYERYVQIQLKQVIEMITNEDWEKMESLYFQSTFGLTKAIGLQEAFTLDKLGHVKWFRREKREETLKKWIPYSEKVQYTIREV